MSLQRGPDRDEAFKILTHALSHKLVFKLHIFIYSCAGDSIIILVIVYIHNAFTTAISYKKLIAEDPKGATTLLKWGALRLSY